MPKRFEPSEDSTVEPAAGGDVLPPMGDGADPSIQQDDGMPIEPVFE